MIYDCFTFFNELELLEMRLHELAGVVDRFVLVEATQTHTNKPKPLHYRENRDRFSAFHDKIIHVVVDDMPQSSDAWIPENFQRKCIARGLTGCRPDDYILVSDLDEIPRADVVERMTREIPFHEGLIPNAVHGFLNSGPVKAVFHRRGFRRRLRKNHPFIWKFRQVLFRHFINCRSIDPGFTFGTRMLRYRDFSCAEEIRHSGYKIVENAGWHFSWMGGVERIRQKLAAYAHQERNVPRNAEAGRIEQSIGEGRLFFNPENRLEFVPLDDFFPRYVLENREKFATWIKPLQP